MEARHRRRRGREPERGQDDGKPEEQADPIRVAPRTREREERAALRRAANRRRLIRTVVVVGGLTALYLVYFVVRMRMRR